MHILNLSFFYDEYEHMSIKVPHTPSASPLMSVSTPFVSTWVEISSEAFEHNIRAYYAVTKPAALAVVIKSNGYGHGLLAMGKLCDSNDLIAVLCTVSVTEALALREARISKPILVLSIIDAPIAQAIQHDIAMVVHDLAFARTLDQAAQRLNKKAKIHFKVDTGLSRLGIAPHLARQYIEEIHQMSGIIIEGIFTHLADSESEDQSFVHYQLQQFSALTEQLRTQGIVIPLQHTACSAAAAVAPLSRHTMVRIGIGSYGLWPSAENKFMTTAACATFSLKPVLTWKTSIIQVKEIAAGSFVGYDRTHQVTRATRIATLPVGYWDGYDRRLSNKGKVMIHDQIANVVGRIAMNLMMVDVTDIDAQQGDTVTLLGNYPGLTADDIAQICGTINYEIVTRINPLLPRLVV
jgi:alanine racemase